MLPLLLLLLPLLLWLLLLPLLLLLVLLLLFPLLLLSLHPGLAELLHLLKLSGCKGTPERIWRQVRIHLRQPWHLLLAAPA
jgi:hypothetical protein